MVDFYRPNNFTEALNLVNSKEIILLAGGTDLMVKNRVGSGTIPNFNKKVVGISHLQELKNIEKNEEFLIIGSACTLTEIIESKLVPEYIKSVLLEMAAPATRNIATMGGNICNASPAGDSLPPLYALDANLILESIHGKRKVSIDNFIHGPGKADIKNNEILKEIHIPVKNFNKFYYKKVGTRKATALSKISFFGAAEIERGLIKDLRIAFGAAAPTVVRSKKIENKIVGLQISEMNNILQEIKNDYVGLLKPIDDQRSSAEYRKKVLLNLLDSFLREIV